MRICFIADAASIHTQRWVNYFAEKGHEVHLISWKGGGDYAEGVHIYSLSKLSPRIWPVSKCLAYFVAPIQTRRLVRMIEPDILDAHFITENGYLGAVTGFHPLILTAWGSDILVIPKRNPIHRFFTKQALKRADHIICVSPAIKEEIVGLGSNIDKVKIIPIGINTSEFSPKPNKERIMQVLGIPDSVPIVISIRSLDPFYNVESLVKAIPLVVEEVPEAKFVIAGKESQRGYLEKLAISLDITDSIRFVDWIPDNELPEYLASSDVYVSTSPSDGTSVSLLEAMACELAPVVTDIAGNRPWVKDGENGFLFPVRDHKMLAIKIAILLKDDKLRSNFGKISRNIVAKRAEHRKEMARVEETYRKVIRMKSVVGSY